MSSGGGGTSTTTTQSGPPQQFLDAYSNVVGQGQQVAAQPLNQYPGNVVAGLSPDQQSAIQGIQGAQGIANPYINAAAQYIGNANSPLQPAIQPYVDTAGGNFQSATDYAKAGQGASRDIYAQMPGAASSTLGSADQMFLAGANKLTPTQFSAGQVGQYESPYTQQVVNATQNQFNNQNAIQQQGIIGNAISNGAFGGDRTGVAQGITAGQQQLAQAPVIAGLENQGYAQALQEFNQQQQTALGAQQATQQLQQAAGQGILGAGQQYLGALQGAGQGILAGTGQVAGAYQGAGQGVSGLAGQVLGANQAQNWLASQSAAGMAGLGNQALNSSLTGAGALMGAGGLEQQIAQEQLNVPYQQYIAQQAYPFQTTGWLANIAEGLGGAAGGNSSTTTPGPSALSQGVGLGLTGLGAAAYANQAGLFGSGGGGGAAASAAPAFYDATGFMGNYAARGGAIPQRGPGGSIPIPTGIPDLSMSIVPGASGMGTAPSSSHGGLGISQPTGSTSTTEGGGPSGGQQAQSALSTVASIAGIAAMAFSDRRLKEDISRVGSMKDGTPIHRFRYKGDPQWHIGVIADQLEHKHPEALGMSHGYQTVDMKAATDDSARASGGIVGFPQRQTRMPGTGRGIVGNDNWGLHPHAPRLAAGGVNLPMLPTNAGAGIIASHGGVNIPMLPTVGEAGGSVVPASGGMGRVNDYLAQNVGVKQPLSSPSGAGIVALHQPPPPAPGAGMGPTDWPTMAPPVQDTRAWEQGSGGGGSEGGGDGGGGGSEGGGEWRGGTVQHRYDGGSLNDEEDLPVPPMPPAGGPPPMAQGIVPGGGPPPPPAPPTDQGAGIMGPIGGAPTGDPSGYNPAPDNGMGIAPAPAPQDHGRSHIGETLLMTGLAMMGGSSPFAGVNIGRGGQQGLQFGEQVRQREELADLRRLQVEELAGYRKDRLGQTAQTTAAQQELERQKLAQSGLTSSGHLDIEKQRLALQEQLAEQGKFTWSPGMGPDPNDPSKQISGMYRLPTTGQGQPEFIAGQTLTSKASTAASNIPPDVTQMLAQRVMAGDNSALVGLGYGTAGVQARMAVQGEVTHQLKAQGLTGADLAAKLAEYMGERAGARTAGTREANVSMAVNEAQNFMPLALQASQNVNRTQFPTINSVLQAYEKGSGDENIVRLAVATNSLTNAYSRAITPSGIPTEGNQTRARELLDKAWSKGQYATAVDQLWKEMQAAKASPIQVREEQKQRISGRDPNAGATTPALTASPAPASTVQWQHEAVGPNGVRVYSNDGKSWFDVSGKPFQPAGP